MICLWNFLSAHLQKKSKRHCSKLPNSISSKKRKTKKNVSHLHNVQKKSFVFDWTQCDNYKRSFGVTKKTTTCNFKICAAQRKKQVLINNLCKSRFCFSVNWKLGNFIILNVRNCSKVHAWHTTFGNTQISHHCTTCLTNYTHSPRSPSFYQTSTLVCHVFGIIFPISCVL